jgi:hypothetical protein
MGRGFLEHKIQGSTKNQVADIPIAPIHKFTGIALSLSVYITTISYSQHKHGHALILNACDDSKITDSVFPELAKG